MSKYPVRLAERSLREIAKDAVDVIGPAARANTFVRFRYSYTEISASGGNAHVKSRNTRLEDGKLTSEAFEGDLDRGAYEQIVGEAQHHFLGQTALLLQSLSWFLPSSWKQSSDD